jgi:hypothetical protein
VGEGGQTNAGKMPGMDLAGAIQEFEKKVSASKYSLCPMFRLIIFRRSCNSCICSSSQKRATIGQTGTVSRKRQGSTIWWRQRLMRLQLLLRSPRLQQLARQALLRL